MSTKFESKIHIARGITDYGPVLKDIAMIHNAAAYKYSLFSWEKEVKPETSCTWMCCMSAILRHACLMYSGELLDAEDHNSHMAHIACRGHMLLTRGYRDRIAGYNSSIAHADPKSLLPKESIFDDSYFEYVSISPEFYIHIGKNYPTETTTKSDLLTFFKDVDANIRHKKASEHEIIKSGDDVLKTALRALFSLCTKCTLIHEDPVLWKRESVKNPLIEPVMEDTLLQYIAGMTVLYHQYQK